MFIAEREGFEPPEVLPSTVFKTAAIDHSAISPKKLYVNRFLRQPLLLPINGCKGKQYLRITQEASRLF